MSNTNYFAMQDDYNEFEMWQGLRGPYFQPHVASDGTLSWTNNGGFPNPDPITIEGHDGAPGFSPTVEIQQIQGGHRVIITDEDGPHSFDVIDYMEGRAIQSTVLNANYTLTIYYTDGTSYTTPSIRGATGPAGDNGTDGVSPEVTITTITGGHRVKITDADHPQGQSFDVMDGSSGGGSVSSVNNVQPDASGNVTLAAANISTSGSQTVQATLTDLSENKQNKIAASGILKGDGSGSVSAAVAGTDYQTPFKTTTLTIETSEWTNNSVSKTVSGMTATSLVFVEFSDTTTDYTVAQSTNTLTFTASAAPSSQITVKVGFLV